MAEAIIGLRSELRPPNKGRNRGRGKGVMIGAHLTIGGRGVPQKYFSELGWGVPFFELGEIHF
jgi:hypothetical protein